MGVVSMFSPRSDMNQGLHNLCTISYPVWYGLMLMSKKWRFSWYFG